MQQVWYQGLVGKHLSTMAQLLEMGGFGCSWLKSLKAKAILFYYAQTRMVIHHN
jgi:hypothetical protein